MDTQMLIGTNLETGTEAEETIFSPRTGETIMTLPEASAYQINHAVAAARAALTGWARTKPAERSARLLAIAPTA